MLVSLQFQYAFQRATNKAEHRFMFTGHFCFFYERPACVFCPFLCQVVFVTDWRSAVPYQFIYIHVLVICILFQFGLIVSLSGMFGKLKYLLSM